MSIKNRANYFQKRYSYNVEEIGAGCHIEMYSNPTDYPKGTGDENYYSEIWIPVRRK